LWTALALPSRCCCCLRPGVLTASLGGWWHAWRSRQ